MGNFLVYSMEEYDCMETKTISDKEYITEANNIEDAIDKIISKRVFEDEYFQEWVYSKVINAGFIEELYEDNKGYLIDEITGAIRKDLKKRFLSKKQLHDYIEKCIIDNAHKFFNDEEYSNLYIKHFFNENTQKIEFPKEMLVYIWKKVDFDFLTAEEI